MDLVAEYLEGGELFERIVEKETVSNMYCSFYNVVLLLVYHPSLTSGLS